MSESRIKQMKRIARIFQSVSYLNLRQSAILIMQGLELWRIACGNCQNQDSQDRRTLLWYTLSD